jgi:hypothetical protein
MLTFHTGLFAMIRYLDATVFSMPLDYRCWKSAKTIPQNGNSRLWCWGFDVNSHGNRKKKKTYQFTRLKN